MSSNVENILKATINGEPYDRPPMSRVENLLLELKAVIEAGGGGGGTAIDDNIISKNTTWSSSKLNAEITANTEAIATKQETLYPGDNISIERDAETDHLVISSTGGGTGDYDQLINKPSINGSTIEGNMTSEDIDVAPKPKVVGENLIFGDN